MSVRPGRVTASSSSSSLDERSGRGLQRTAAEDRKSRLRDGDPDERKGTQQRGVVLLFDQAADGQDKRDVLGDPGSGGGRLRTRRRQLVEPVPDRQQLRWIVPRRLQEAADGVGDRDQTVVDTGEGAVDIAEGAEEVAVVVVARGDRRRAGAPWRRLPPYASAWTRCVCRRSGRSARTALITSRAIRGLTSDPQRT